jgi:hypothetical protein
MATTLKKYTFTKGGPRKPRKTKGYPWEKWTDGKIRRLKRGRDFEVSPNSFQRIVWETARRRGLNVQTQIEDDDTVVIQFTSE